MPNFDESSPAGDSGERDAPEYVAGLADYLDESRPMTPVSSPPTPKAPAAKDNEDGESGLTAFLRGLNPFGGIGRIAGPLVNSPTVQGPIGQGVDALLNATGTIQGVSRSAPPVEYGQAPEKSYAAALADQIGDQPIMRPQEAMVAELGSRTMQLLAQRGEAADIGDTPIEQIGSRTMVQSALEVTQKGAAGGATPEMLKWAADVLTAHHAAQMDSVVSAEQGRASLALGPEDYARRVVELKGKGFSDEAIAQIMHEGKWNSDLVSQSFLDRMDDEVQILGMQGELSRAARLQMAKVSMLKQGIGALDVNAKPGDVMMDAMARQRADQGGPMQAFDANAANAALSTTTGMLRLAGALPPGSQDKSILERYAQATQEKYPLTSAAGELSGGFVDPVFYAANAAMSGVKATAPMIERYTASLVERGVPQAVAEQQAKSLTMEGAAREGLTNFFQRSWGIGDASVARSMSNITWNATAGAIAGGATSALQMAPEDMSPLQRAMAVLGGAGKGALFGLGVGALHVGGAAILDRVKTQGMRLLQGIDPDLPAGVSEAVGNAYDYVHNGLDGDSVKPDIGKVFDVVHAIKDGLGRTPTEQEVQLGLDEHGIDLGYLKGLKVEQGDALRNTIRAIEEKLQDPNIEPEQRAAMTKTWERAQRMLADQGAPEQEMTADKTTPEQAAAAVHQQLMEAEPDSAVLSRLKALDAQAREERGLQGEDLEEYKGLLGQVVSRNLTPDFKIQSAQDIEGPLTGNAVRKWESSKDAMLRNAQRKAQLAGPRKGVRGPEIAQEIPVATRADVLEGFKQAFQLPDEQHQAIAAVLDAAGNTLTKKGVFQSPEEFFGKTFAKPRTGGTPGADSEGGALFQTQGASADLPRLAEEKYGTTKDLGEAGYVLPNGKMLDFSGRGLLDEGAPAGYRNLDHRALQPLGLTPNDEGMHAFMASGPARVDFGAGVVQIGKPLEQLSEMLGYRGALVVDTLTQQGFDAAVSTDPTTNLQVLGGSYMTRAVINTAVATIRGKNGRPFAGGRMRGINTMVPKAA